MLCAKHIEAERWGLDSPLSDYTFKLRHYRLVGSLDDLEGPMFELGHGCFQLWSSISTVGKNMTQPGKAATDRGEQRHGAIAILNVGRVDQQADQEPHRVSDNVTFASRDLLGRILSFRTATLCGLDRLAVDDACAGTALSPCRFPDLHQQGMVDLSP